MTENSQESTELKLYNAHPSWNVRVFSEEITKVIERFEDETGFKVKNIDIDRHTRDMTHNGATMQYESIKAIPLVIIESA